MEKKLKEGNESESEGDNIINTNKNKITQKHLYNLDEFIQKCLDNFKFVEPKQELYDATGEDKNIIISHKSTIPDLVIWNKTFNKNNCFYDANNNKETKFPRYLFYIKIKKNKKTKKNNTDNKKNNNSEGESFENNKIENNKEKIDNKNNMNYNYNTIKNKKFNKTEEKNKFSINLNNNINNIENNMNNINTVINLATYLIQLYLYKNGWIILEKDKFSGPGTSINLYQYFQEKLKENCNLDNFIIIDINKQVKFTGNYFYNLLSNVLNKILQKKQMELIKFEEIMNKQFKNDIIGNNNNNQNINSNNININLYNNQIFPGINYIENINNNITNSNFIQNNITKYEYNIQQYPKNKKQNKK